MPLSDKKWTISTPGIDRPGVYELWDASGVIYIGSSTVSIRDRLNAHANGSEGRCTEAATHYKEEESGRPVERERALLHEHQQTFGHLPRCNDRIP